jgi:CDP-diacylglycerol--glycerol-3-phosphate 3-phosphatidyltransferase
MANPKRVKQNEREYIMNLPNKLTVIRMALVPVFFIFFHLGNSEDFLRDIFGVFLVGYNTDYLHLWFFLAAFIVFAVASLTDALDGHIARKRGLITNFGKLMDPLADKVLTTAAFICFVETGTMAGWMLVVIVAREFAITGLRGVAASEGTVIAAGMSGKLKTVLQMSAIILILLVFVFESAAFAVQGSSYHDLFMDIGEVLNLIGQICLYAAVAATVWSGVEYLWKGRKLLNAK